LLVLWLRTSSRLDPSPGDAERPGEASAALDFRAAFPAETPYQGQSLAGRVGNYSRLPAPEAIDIVPRPQAIGQAIG
jgi:hypothetical protein